jgi:hypothetical protein
MREFSWEWGWVRMEKGLRLGKSLCRGQNAAVPQGGLRCAMAMRKAEATSLVLMLVPSPRADDLAREQIHDCVKIEPAGVHQ